MSRKPIHRRVFLRDAGIAMLALAPVGAAYARSLERRTLSFEHTHTGESLSVLYFRAGEYLTASLEQINWVLRDFRTDETHPIDTRTLDILFDLQTLANRDEPYQVISGYRSARTNAALRSYSKGVAEHSLHIEGRAIDVRLPGFSSRRLYELAREMQRGGVGYYPQSDFVHLDSGPVRFW